MANLTAEALEARLASLARGDFHGYVALLRLFLDTEPMEALYRENRGAPHVDLAAYMAAELIKSRENISDEELVRRMGSDADVAEALGGVTMRKKTLSRTRGLLRDHLKRTGEDLVDGVLRSAIGDMARLLGFTEKGTRLMDSAMVETFAKKLGRREPLYVTCFVLVRAADRAGLEIPEGLRRLLDKSDRNSTIYHKRKDGSVAQGLIAGCEAALEAFGGSGAAEVAEAAGILAEALDQQTIVDGGPGRFRKSGEYYKGGDIIQTPFDLTARYREKNGGHTGHVLNLVEGLREYKGVTVRITVGHEPRPNTHSDAAFGRGYFEKVLAGQIKAPELMVCDGAYDGGEMNALAAEAGVRLVRTNLTGKKPNPILAEFELLEGGAGAASCPAGHAPRRSSVRKDGALSLSFDREVCSDCPRRGECRPRIGKRTAGKALKPSSVRRAQEIKFRSTEEFSGLSAKRNGTESINGQLKGMGLNSIRFLDFEKKRRRVDFLVAVVDLKRLCGAVQEACDREDREKAEAES